MVTSTGADLKTMVREFVQWPAGYVRGAVAALRGDGRGWVLLSVAVGWLLVLGLRFAVPTLLPGIKVEFGIDNATAGAAITLIWGSYGLMQFPAGVLVDHVGERRLLAGSLLAAGASMVGFALAPVFSLFLVVCALFGIGTGLYGPARSIVISNTYPENDGAAFGATLAAGSIGAATFPLVVALVATRLGWRSSLWLLVPSCLLGAGLLWWAVPATGSNTDVSEPERAGPAATVKQVTAVLRRRTVLVMLGAVTLMLFVMQGLTAFLPTYLVERGFEPGTAAGMYTLLFVSGALFQSVAGTAADRFGDRQVLTITGGVSVLPLIALPFVDDLLPLVFISSLLGVRLGVMPVSNAYMVRELPTEIQGTAWGLIRTVFFAFGATGSVAVGVLADYGLFDESFLALAALTAIATALYRLLPSDATSRYTASEPVGRQ